VLQHAGPPPDFIHYRMVALTFNLPHVKWPLDRARKRHFLGELIIFWGELNSNFKFQLAKPRRGRPTAPVPFAPSVLNAPHNHGCQYPDTYLSILRFYDTITVKRYVS
jgi:hypothetical protein